MQSSARNDKEVGRATGDKAAVLQGIPEQWSAAGTVSDVRRTSMGQGGGEERCPSRREREAR